MSEEVEEKKSPGRPKKAKVSRKEYDDIVYRLSRNKIAKTSQKEVTPDDIEKKKEYESMFECDTLKNGCVVVKDAVGSVNPEYKFDKSEEDLVHVRLNDYGYKRPTDWASNSNWKAPATIKKYTPQKFVEIFGAQFIGDDAFVSVDTPGKIVRLAKNMKAETIKECYSEMVYSAAKGSKEREKNKITDIASKLRHLRVGGGVGGQLLGPKNITVGKAFDAKDNGDILHIPNDPAYPFDPEELATFPDECVVYVSTEMGTIN